MKSRFMVLVLVVSMILSACGDPVGTPTQTETPTVAPTMTETAIPTITETAIPTATVTATIIPDGVAEWFEDAGLFAGAIHVALVNSQTPTVEDGVGKCSMREYVYLLETTYWMFRVMSIESAIYNPDKYAPEKHISLSDVMMVMDMKLDGPNETYSMFPMVNATHYQLSPYPDHDLSYEEVLDAWTDCRVETYSSGFEYSTDHLRSHVIGEYVLACEDGHAEQYGFGVCKPENQEAIFEAFGIAVVN